MLMSVYMFGFFYWHLFIFSHISILFMHCNFHQSEPDLSISHPCTEFSYFVIYSTVLNV